MRFAQRLFRIAFFQHRNITVLGIESSCDDSAVAIVREDKKILSSRRFTDRDTQRRLGGISPREVALQHRTHLPLLLAECLDEAKLNFSDIDAIAATTKPGLVIALKEGIQKGLELSRQYKKDFISIHHMRAHALCAFLICDDLQFPFLSVLISGGHSLIALASSDEDFTVYGSPGECLDKIARELQLNQADEFRNIHPGAAIEQLARRCSDNGHLRYSVPGPRASGADMDFSALKSSCINYVRKERTVNHFLQKISVRVCNPSIPLVCLYSDTKLLIISTSSLDINSVNTLAYFLFFLGYRVTRHLVSKLHCCLEYLSDSGQLSLIKKLVISGGVAANDYICNGISKLAIFHGLDVVRVDSNLCTDNAEMVAWNGIMSLLNNSTNVHRYPQIPESIYVHDRFPIGRCSRSLVPSKPRRKLTLRTVHGDIPLKFFDRNFSKGEEDKSNKLVCENS
ncbi:peptidase, M22 family [Dictyocaulus viviparus]|uniref:N(6)-L-threonylcarbamoyladenine synthase n=1 Tax=Dictyocaulus viviparus TaxID=29172 RepID=A0A0D8Y4Y5_DICVI|nr:peptidase, M22 family [Dictyocaulus viviparus]